jgi:hypothetical protein
MMFLYTATVWEVRTVNLSASAATKAYTDVVNPHLFSGTCTTTLRDIYTDGSQGTTQGTTEANKNSPDVSIGHQLGQAGTTNDFAGRAGEIVLFTGTSTTDRQITEGYLAWKWGLQALLPPGHPYSGGPPTLGIQINLSSVSSIAATGVFSPNNFLNLSLTGVRSSSNVGSLDKSNSINLNGIKATAQVGIFDFTHTFPNDAIAPSLIEKIRKKKKKWKGKQPEVQFKKTPDKLYIRTVEKIKRPRFRIPQNDDDEDELEIILRTLL